MSWVIYGRKVIDKTEWVIKIDPYMSDTEFNDMMSSGTKRLYRTVAEQCTDCVGSGYIRKTKKNGEPFAKPSRCHTCNAEGFLFKPTDTLAGFKFKPPSPKWASANGFTTSKINLEILEGAARSKGMTDAQTFYIKCVG